MPNPPGVPQVQVIAHPEFLPPPREFVVAEDTIRPPRRLPVAQTDRREAYDEDVQTLPSRRGQYRRRD